MVMGVSEGFTKTLEFQGVGYRAAVKGKDLELNLGYSHPITVTAPEGIEFSVEKSTITVSGTDREVVGHIAAVVRSKRPPEPYKGAGIRYSDEVIRRKQGKKTAA
jgi:large subunit ribosomal protein L6